MKKLLISVSLIFLFFFLGGCEDQDGNFTKIFTNESSYPVTVIPASDNPEQGWTLFELEAGESFLLKTTAYFVSWQYSPREKVKQVFGPEKIVYSDR